MTRNVALESFTPLQVVSGIKAAANTAQGVRDLLNDNTSDSLVEYTRATRVEPLVLMDQTLVHETVMSDLLHTTSSIFTGYYLLGVAAMTNINGVSVLQRLEKFNPKRSVVSAVIGAAVGNESYDVTLPDYSKSYQVATESDNSKTVGNKVSDSLKQLDRLAVGKVIEVKIQENDTTYTIPISIRLIPISSPPAVIKSIFSLGSQKNTLKERWHSWRAGEISLVNDLIFNQDLVKQHLKTLTLDKSGFYAEVSARKRGNSLASLISGTPSVATASNIAIISSRTAVDIERELGGPLSNFKVREEALDKTSIMILCVVDTSWERVDIYHKSIPYASNFSFQDIKSMGKDQSPNIMEIMKTLLGGKATGSF